MTCPLSPVRASRRGLGRRRQFLRVLALGLCVAVVVPVAGCTPEKPAARSFMEVTWSPEPDGPWDSDPAVQTLREWKLIWAQAWNTRDSSDPHLDPYDAKFLFETALRYINDGGMWVGPDPLVVLKVEPVPDSPNTSRVWVCERMARSWGRADGEVRLSGPDDHPVQATYLVTVDPTGGDAWKVENDGGYDMSCDDVSEYPTATFDPPLTPEYVEAVMVNRTAHDVVGPGGVRGDQDVEWVDDADGIRRPVVRSPSPSP